MVFLAEKPKNLEEACWRVLVIKGGEGFLLDSLFSMLLIEYFESSKSFLIFSASL